MRCVIERRRDAGVTGQLEFLSRGFEQLLRHADAIVLDQRFARLESHRLEERARHCTADYQSVDLGQQILDDVELAGDLRAAKHGNERALRIGNRTPEELELLLHQQTSNGGLEVTRHAFRRGMGAVCRAECVVHV